MAPTRLVFATALSTLVVAAACGDSVVITSEGTGSAGTGGDATAGGGGTASGTSSSGGPTVCQGAACGDPCTVCNDVECLQGLCDEDGSCAPFDAVTCPTGAGGGAPGCPPPEDVSGGEPCDDEGQVCSSANSCSGVLDCFEGEWTLFQPC